MASNLPSHLEALAQKQFQYLDLFERCASEVRKDLVRGKEAYDKVNREWDVVIKPGETRARLLNPPEDPTVSQKMLEEICSIEPGSLEDHIKVMTGAFGMLNSMSLYDMCKLTEEEMTQVDMRIAALVRQSLVMSDPTSTLISLFHPHQHSQPEPLAFPGQTFSLDNITYQITGIFLDADKALRYKIKYGDEREEELGLEEMRDMLEGSQLLDV